MLMIQTKNFLSNMIDRSLDTDSIHNRGCISLPILWGHVGEMFVKVSKMASSAAIHPMSILEGRYSVVHMLMAQSSWPES